MYVRPRAWVFEGTGRGCTKTLFMGARDGCSSFFVCGRAHFLSWWAVVVCGWLEWVILVAGGLSRVITIDLSMDGRVSQGGLKCRLILPHTLWVSLCSGLPSWPFVNGGGGPSWPFVGTCRSWWSSWPVGHHRCSSMVVLGACGHLWAVVTVPRSWWWILVANRRWSWWVLIVFHGGCQKRVW